MKVYIAGKITGDRRYRAKFREAAKALEEAGHVVLNPATLPDGLADADYMRICMAMVDAAAMYPMPWVNINTFWSMEPLLGPVDMSAAEGLPQWVILGAETGSRPDKVTPRREWVDQIAEFCAENEIPVFYKDNLRAHFQDLPPSASPWEV